MAKKNKNFCFVSIRQDRNCFHCKELIPKGTKVLTINKKGEGRKWMCPICYRLYRSIERAEDAYNSVSFGDEGGAFAALDYLDEVRSEYYARER